MSGPGFHTPTRQLHRVGVPGRRGAQDEMDSADSAPQWVLAPREQLRASDGPLPAPETRASAVKLDRQGPFKSISLAGGPGSSMRQLGMCWGQEESPDAHPRAGAAPHSRDPPQRPPTGGKCETQVSSRALMVQAPGSRSARESTVRTPTAWAPRCLLCDGGEEPACAPRVLPRGAAHPPPRI